MKNKEKIQLLEHRLNIHSELLERIISKLEFDDANEPEPKKLDHSVFDGLESKWKYAAVDANGEANLYTHHIIPDSVEFAYCDDINFDCQTIGTDYDVIDWKNSLIKRETNELTGSELCKAMLARGDKYVLCLVNDSSEESARSYERVRVISSQGADYFDDTTEDMWYFAIPINSQGKPLTSSDVDL